MQQWNGFTAKKTSSSSEFDEQMKKGNCIFALHFFAFDSQFPTDF
jgi:hypothetical protein